MSGPRLAKERAARPRQPASFLLTLLVAAAHVGLHLNARKVAVRIGIALPLALLAAWWAAGAWALQRSRAHRRHNDAPKLTSHPG